MSGNNDQTSNELQKYINELKAECNTMTPGSQEKTKCDAIVTKLTDIDASQITNEINEVNDANKDTTVNLADKKTTVKIMNEKTNNIQQHIDNIKQERLNKKRVVEASEWEYDRYTSHIFYFSNYQYHFIY